MKIDWAFQLNEDGSSQGWNDPSIAEFKSNRLQSLTREIIQNSLDAALDDNSPVYVDFIERQISAENIPNIETLRHVVQLCDKEIGSQNPDMIKEFLAAKEIIKRTKIPVLSIEDYNTRGMRGPCEPGFPFYQYLKAVGVNGGATTRAGSHGLGKAAPLACSDLRTIIVSTNWDENGEMKGLVQGRAVLMSFQTKEGMRNAKGYWGNANKYQALKPEDVPADYSWILRKDIGTTVHVVGWNRIVPDNWEKLIIGFAISNFFAAFMSGKLIVKVNRYEVNSTNIFEMARNEAIVDAMKKNRSLDLLHDAQYYMRILSDKDTVIREETQLTHLGRTSIKLLITDDAPRKIALIRNKMLITDSIPGFWKKIPGRFRDFVGLVEVLDPAGSQFIRLMEPPSHNSLSIDWLPTNEDRKKGEVALDQLSERLKEFVDRHASGDSDVFGKVDFMADFFADEAGDDRGESLDGEIDPNGNFTFAPKAIKTPPTKRITLESELEGDMDDTSSATDIGSAVDEEGESEASGAGGAGTVGGNGKSNGKQGPSEGDGDGGVGNRPQIDTERDKPSHPIQLRGIRIVKTGERSARVFATPSANARANLRVHEVGSDFDDPFEVSTSDVGSVVRGGVQIDLKEGKRLDLTVVFSRPIVGGLKLVASHHISGEKK